MKGKNIICWEKQIIEPETLDFKQKTHPFRCGMGGKEGFYLIQESWKYIMLI
jgi:hypothetical protein